MDIKEAVAMIGKTVYIVLDKFNIECVVKDVKHTYGRVRFQVVPVAGTGEAWVEYIKPKG